MNPVAQSPSIERMEWEYKDFVYKFPPPDKGLWVATHAYGGEGFTPAGAKVHFYQEYQREIRAELQKWLDEGWQPIGEVGPAAIEIRTRWSHRDKTARYWLLYLLFSIPTAGVLMLFALLNVTEIAEPTQFVVQMRRPKYR